MEKYLINFSIKEIKYSDDKKHINENLLCFPKILLEVIKNASDDIPRKIDKEILLGFGILVLHENNFITIKKKIIKDVGKNIFFSSVLIKIPFEYLPNIKFEATFTHEENLTKKDIFCFLENIIKDSELLNDFIISKGYFLDVKNNINKKVNFNKNKLFNMFRDGVEIKSEKFEMNEIFIEDKVNVIFNLDLVRKDFILMYKKDDNKDVINDNKIFFNSLVFKSDFETYFKTGEIKLMAALIDYKIESTNEFLKAKYQHILDNAPNFKFQIKKIDFECASEFILLEFKENCTTPEVTGIVLDQGFLKYGIGRMFSYKGLVSGRGFLDNRLSNKANMYLISLMLSNIVEEDVLREMLDNLLPEIEESDIIKLIEINFISDNENFKDKEKNIERANKIFEELSELLLSNKSLKEFLNEVHNIDKRQKIEN